MRPDEENKKLSVRGVTIALWYFISRGHQAQALMPFCFKTYPNKSDNWNELMALFRMNLIEFTPGRRIRKNSICYAFPLSTFVAADYSRYMRDFELNCARCDKYLF